MRAFRQVALAFGSVLLCNGFALGQARLGPYVIDSNGLKIGHALDVTNALMFIQGDSIAIAVRRSGFTASTFTLVFADGACGGQAQLVAPSTDFLFGAGYYTSDGVIHYFSPTSIVSMDVQSQLTVQTDGTLSACSPYFATLDVAPALTTPGSAFTPPFSVVDTLPVSPAPATATFNDVPTTHPFFRFIEALYNSGITAGCSAAPPLYCPDNPVTRGQMAVFLAKALGL
jgi:hypothetical protein